MTATPTGSPKGLPVFVNSNKELQMIYSDNFEEDRWWIIFMLCFGIAFSILTYIFGYYDGRKEKQCITEISIIHRSTP